MFSTDNDPIKSGDNLLFEFNCKTPVLPEDSQDLDRDVHTWTIKTEDENSLTLAQLYNTRVFSEWYSHEGYTYDLEGNIVENATVRVLVERHHPNHSPPIENDEAGDIYNNYYASSGDNGYFKVENIPGNGIKFRTKIVKFDEDNHLTRISWRPIVLSNSMFDNLDAVRYYMENGVTVNLDTVKDEQFNKRVWDMATNHVKNTLFEEFVDKSTFYHREYSDTFVDNAALYLPASREYKIHVDRVGTPGEISYVLDNIKENASWQENQTIDLEFDATSDVKSFSGYVETPNGVDNFDNLAMLSYQFMKNSSIITYPEDLDWGSEGESTDNFVPENGYYEVNLPSTVYGRDYLLFCTAYDNSENQYYGGLKQISLFNDNDHIELENLTLQPLLGDPVEYSLKSQSDNRDTVSVSTAMKRLQFKGPGSERLENFQNIIQRAKVDYSEYSDWDVGSIWWKGAVREDFPEIYAFPIFENVGIEKLEVYSFDGIGNTSLSADRMAEENDIEVTLYPFNPRGIDGQDFSNINFEIYKNEPSYNVPNPDTSGLLWSTGEERFNPWTVMLGGGDLSFRISKEDDNIAVHYNNVNLLRSGPPDALFDTEPDNVEIDGTLAEAWRFGTMGPDIYDNIILGMPYDENEYSEGDNFLIRIKEFYDDEWNPIWDIGDNSLSELPEEYEDYAESPYEAYINDNLDPVLASETDQNSLAYVDTENHMVWMRIPHFSGVSPSLILESLENQALENQEDGDGTGDSEGVPSENGSADFEVSNLNINLATVERGQQVSVSANITNIGDESGVSEVEFFVDSELEDNELVNLSEGESVTVNFETSRDNLGVYEIMLSVGEDSETRTFEVIEEAVMHNLVIDIEGKGSTDPSEGTNSYQHGEEIAVKAIPDDGWSFKEWTGDVDSENKEITIVMNENKELTAIFDVHIPENIVEIEDVSDNITDISPEIPGFIELESTEVESVNVNVREDVQNVKLFVKQLSDEPMGILEDSPGILYKCYQFEIKNLTVGQTENVVITSKVSKEWIEEENIDKDSLTMYRYSVRRGEWENLETKEMEEDDDYVYINSVSESFSLFSVTGELEDSSEPGLPWTLIAIVLVVAGSAFVLIGYMRNSNNYNQDNQGLPESRFS